MESSGSSPRVWGQAVANILRPKEFGIIPTRMGTRYTHSRELCACGDHPHAYGDKPNTLCIKALTLGSSPRVWGQATYTTENDSIMRIIPTRMGTRRVQPRRITSLWDHPHAYGDKISILCSGRAKQGSSPRVWGQGILIVGSYAPAGIIPTRMGTSLHNFPQIPYRRDHPHAYGDKGGGK